MSYNQGWGPSDQPLGDFFDDLTQGLRTAAGVAQTVGNIKRGNAQVTVIPTVKGVTAGIASLNPNTLIAIAGLGGLLLFAAMSGRRRRA